MTLSALANRPTAAVTLDDILNDMQRLADVPPEGVAALLREAGERQGLLATVMTALAVQLPRAARREDDDRLLTVDEAAVVLSQTNDWLYRHAKDLPFTVRVGTLLRFSARGIQMFIRQRRGRS